MRLHAIGDIRGTNLEATGAGRPGPARIVALALGLALSFLPVPAVGLAASESGSTAPATPETERSARPEVGDRDLSPEQRDTEIRSFEFIRETMESRYPNPERLDGSWRSLADSFRAELERVESLAESRSILRALTHSMGESHFGIIPARAYGEIYDRNPKSGEDGGSDDPAGDDSVTAEGAVGIDLRWVDDGLVVVRLHGDGGTAPAGIRPGDEVLSIDGERTEDLAALVAGDPSESVSRFETSVAIAGQLRLRGDLGEEVELEVCRQPGDTLSFFLPVEAWRGTPTKLGALPEQTVQTSSQDLGDIGVFGFSLFLAPTTVMPFVQSCFERFHDRKGIVIDLRGNFGGLMPMIQGIVGWLVDEPTQLGLMKMRGVDLKLFANPRPPRFTGKVAILTDELSISAAELFTAGVQEAGLARVFGTRTAGLALPANVVRLPNGDGFMFVVADYTTPNGQRLERTGVVPDVEVPFTRFQLYEEADPVLQAATDWIRE